MAMQFFRREDMPNPSVIAPPFISVRRNRTTYFSKYIQDAIKDKGPLVFGYDRVNKQIALNHDPKGFLRAPRSRVLYTALIKIGVRDGVKLKCITGVPGFDFLIDLEVQ